MLLKCPEIIIGEFNIYMLRKTSESLTLQNFMGKKKLTFFLLEVQQLKFNNTQINHI
jgi:hypothetical protein